MTSFVVQPREVSRAESSAGSLSFPEGFLWGAGTSAYQIEGAASSDGRGVSIWDTFCRIPGKVRGGDTGDVATDHYHRWKEDVALMRDLGLRSYRFSVSWPRIQPDGVGATNERGLDFYRYLVDELLEAAIVPVLTLFHWDLPQSLQDAGGWPARETAYRFADYATLVFEALGDRVPYWLTVNEPWCPAFLGYGQGVHAPGVVDEQQSVRAAHHLLLAHGLAVQVMRATSRDHAQLGIVLDPQPPSSDSSDREDPEAVRRAEGIHNRLFLDSILKGAYPEDVLSDLAEHVDLSHIRDDDLRTISTPIDVLGINYYRRLEVGPKHAGLPTTDLGWEIDSSGLFDILVHVYTTYGPIPLLITENGAAYNDDVGPEGQVRDPARTSYLEQHVRAAWDVIQAGIDVRGYFVWSLLDNFEWSEGYAGRFGLVYVDYASQQRIPKDSARWYQQVMAENGLVTGPTEPGDR
jgi:beta-glucosidase